MGNTTAFKRIIKDDVVDGHSSSNDTTMSLGRKLPSFNKAKMFLSKSSQEVGFLTEEEKNNIKISWKRIENDISKVGVITFILLFEAHPEVRNSFIVFNGMSLNEIETSKQLRAHALRVMAFVQKVVSKIDEPEALDELVYQLGAKHFQNGTPKRFIDEVGPQFISAIKPSLEDIWSDELENSWNKLFSYLAFYMKCAMTIEEKGKPKRTFSSP